MRFAAKVVPLAVLGCAAALLVACGDRSGLLSSSESSSLQDALAAVQSACADGQPARAEVAARSFGERVGALPPGTVDRKLIVNLQQGASTLDALVAQTCTATATTPTTTTVTTTTTPTTTTTTTTEPTLPTTPTEPTPPPTTPTTPPPTTTPDDGGGGGATTPSDGSGGAGTGGAGVGGAGAPGATP
jgi:hypothetical protein